MSWGGEVRGGAPPADDDALYAGFNEGGVAPLEGVAPATGFGGAGGLPASRWGGLAAAAGPTAGAAGAAQRPLTSVRAAGFTSQPKSGGAPRAPFDPFHVGGAARGPAPPLAERADNSPEDQARDQEKKVALIVQEAVLLSAKGQHDAALDRAKEAGRRERVLCKFRVQNNLQDFINIDLTYSVLLTLATMYERSGNAQEALSTYSLLVKNKQYAQAGRLRVNMGNIYYQQQKYPQAIKMYRMALDQVANIYRSVRVRIMRNIGNAFVRLGMFTEAIESYQLIMDSHPDYRTGFNLLLCYYALGDAGKMKLGFAKLLSIPHHYELEDGDGLEDEERVGRDALKKSVLQRKQDALRIVSGAARLIAPRIEPSMEEGYEHLITMLRSSAFPEVALELENQKAVEYFKNRDFEAATETLRAFVKTDGALVARAATNLSFVYYLEKNTAQAKKFAELAVQSERYNAAALVNLGNALFAEESFTSAEDRYSEALNAEADCTEALYNLGLVQRRLGRLDDALRTFQKLRVILPTSSEVLYHVADICEVQEKYEDAVAAFSELHLRVPSDPYVLRRLGVVCQMSGDDAQAYHHFSEAYGQYPADIEVIEWLASHYVSQDNFEKALPLMDQAAAVQPRDPKWRVMAATCLKRMGSVQQALGRYERVLADFPNNTDCLRFLIQLCTEMGLSDKVTQYATELRRVEALLLNASATAAPESRSNTASPAFSSERTSSRALTPGGGAAGGSAGAGDAALAQPRGAQVLSEEEAAARAHGMLANAPSSPSKRTANSRRGRDDEDWADEGLDDLLPM